MTIQQAKLTGYISDAMIVAQNQRIEELVWPLSKWSKTCKKEPSI